MQDFLDILIYQLISPVLVTDLHSIVRMEPLDIQVGRILVFERLVDDSVVLLPYQLYTMSRKRKLTYLGKFTRGTVPLEMGIELMSIVYILEPDRQLMTGGEGSRAYMTKALPSAGGCESEPSSLTLRISPYCSAC